MIGIGTRVSYMDMANPLREGVIVGEIAGQWLVRWDDEDAPYCAVHEQGDCPDGCPNAWAASVTKQMLERATERQQEFAAGERVRLGGWNVVPADREPLTRADLYAALEDERHHGFGYAERENLPYAARQILDEAVVAVANELGLDREDLFQWADSKNGRWLCDHASSAARLSRSGRDLVEMYLNDVVLAELWAEA